MPTKKKRTDDNRSGTTWSESDYRAAGYRTIKLRLPAETLDHLDALAKRLKRTRWEIVNELILAAKR